jgi:hypothetical protein
VLKIGVSCIDMKPPVGIGLAGFAACEASSIGVHNGLRAEGMPCSSRYVPLYKERFVLDFGENRFLSKKHGKNIDYSRVRLPVTEKACYEEAICFHQYMLLGTKKDMDDIANAVSEIRENAKRASLTKLLHHFSE